MFSVKFILATALTLVSMTASAGRLGFMDRDGHTDINNDVTTIVYAETTVSTQPDQSVQIGVVITDERNRSCYVDSKVLPGSDMAQLAVNAVDKNVLITCKISASGFPKNGSSNSAKVVWVRMSKE